MVIALAALAMVATQASVTVRDLVEMTEIDNIAASPDGHETAYRTARASTDCNCIRTRWYIVPTDGSAAPVPIADGGEAIIDDPGVIAQEPAIWSADGRSLFFRAQFGQQIQIWRASVDGRAATQVTRDPADIRSFRISGTQLIYAVGEPRARTMATERKVYDEGMLVDRTTDLAQPVAGALMVGGQRRMQRFTGAWFDRIPLGADVADQVRILDLKSGTLVTPLAPTASGLGDADIVSEDRYRAHVSRSDGASRIVVTTPLAQQIECLATVCRSGHVLSAVWRPHHHSLVLLLRDGPTRDALYVWRLGARQVRRVPTRAMYLSDEYGQRSACSITVDRAVCQVMAPLEPPKLVAIDLETGGETTLDDPNAGLRATITVRPSALSWRAGKATFSGILLTPQSPAGPAPLVISYYDCHGFLRGGVGDELPILPLVGRGIAVLCIQKPPGVHPFKAEDEYRIAQQGIETIVDRLATQGIIDRRRVGMHGLSFGAETTMWMMRHTSIVATGAISSLQISSAYFWANALPGRDMPKMLGEAYGLGWPDRDPTRWAAISPALNTVQLKAPLLMQLPEQEARWAGENYASALRDGKAIELYAFADENHIKAQPRHKQAVYARNLDWFDYWLQGATDPDPSKASQYARWRALPVRPLR